MSKIIHLERFCFLFFSLLILMHSTFLFAQVPNFIWANAAGGSEEEMVYAMDYTSNHSVAVGWFHGTIRIGSKTLTSKGDSDIIIVHYDGNGDIVWIRHIGGVGTDRALSVAIGRDHFIVVTGWFTHPLIFGSTTLNNSGAADLFVAAFDWSGAPVWVKQAGGRDGASGIAIDTDENNNVYIGGSFKGIASFGPKPVNLSSAGGDDIFIAKYDHNGEFKWVQRAGGTGDDFADDIAVDENGYFMITGQFSGSARFRAVMHDIILQSKGGYDVFIARYSADAGLATWAQSVGGREEEWGPSVAVDDDGNWMLAGNFSGSITAGTKTLSSAGNQDFFLIRYDKTGDMQWAIGNGGRGDEIVHDIAIDKLGNSVITGSFDSEFKHGTIAILPQDGDDAFVACYDHSSRPIWANRLSGREYQVGRAVIVDDVGNRVVAGTFKGSIAIGQDSFISSGSQDLFVASLNNFAPPVLTITDLWWEDEQDRDGDGYVQSATLCWRTRLLQGTPPQTIYDRLFWKLSGSKTWTQGETMLTDFSQDQLQSLLIKSSNIGILTGRSSVTFLLGMGADFMGTQLPYYEFDAGNFPELNNYRMEPTELDVKVDGNIVTGKVNYYANGEPVRDADVKIGFIPPYTIKCTTNYDGAYSFVVGLGSFGVLATKSNDVKSSIDAYDAAMVLQDIAGFINLTPYQMLTADVSANRTVSADDASFILRRVVGLENFPVDEEWRFVPASFEMDEKNWSSAPATINVSLVFDGRANQNFLGLVVGDVSGNWTIKGLNIPSGHAELWLGQAEQINSNEIRIPIEANITGDLLAATMELRFEHERMRLQDVQLAPELTAFQIAHSCCDDILRIAFAGPEPVRGKNVRLTLVSFKVENPQPDISAIAALTNAVLNEGSISVRLLETQVMNESAFPSSHELLQNSPNPFNPETSIAYHVAEPAHVSLTIFDITGKEVIKFDTPSQSAGRYAIQWDSRDVLGQRVPSGMYFYRLEIIPPASGSQPFVQVKKMMFVK